MNKLIPLLMIVVWGGSTAAQQPAIPTDLTFRPKTFARPSRAILSFRYGSDYFPAATFGSYPMSYYRTRSLSPYSYSSSWSYSSSLSPAAAGRSTYYDSVIGNYGASPYTGLDASQHLYSSPNGEWTSSHGDDYTDPFYYLNQTYSHRHHRSQHGH